MRSLNARVKIVVPGRSDIRYGVRPGTFDNGRGKWASVMLDGHKTLSWFWHEYVTEIEGGT